MLIPPRLPDFPALRIDDPRLHQFILRGAIDASAIQPACPVLLGFPIDDGVRRNGGRIGAAGGPDVIRGWLYRLTPTDPPSGLDIRELHPLDLGNLRPLRTLEESQEALGSIIGQLLQAGAVPIILGGGHETAFGHYLGYCCAGIRPSIINLDAHLDVRPMVGGLGTNGTPFRQAMIHTAAPLEPACYTCLGIQPQMTSQEHWEFCRRRGDTLVTADEMHGQCAQVFERACSTLGNMGGPIYLSVDADVARAADVPGVSAPNPTGLAGHELLACARRAGMNPQFRSFDLVELNPAHDVDQRGARWAATMVWHFLIGLVARRPTAR